MTPARLISVVRAALIAAVMASAALMIDYQNPGDPAFCGVDSPCLQLRRSSIGQQIAQQLYPMNLPQVGLLVFVVLLTFSFFVTSRRHLQALGAALFFGALGAAGLIYAQASISTFCLYCMTVDLSTIVAAIAVMFIVAKTPSDEAFDALVKPSMRWEIALRWALAGAVAIAAPFMWARYPVVPPVPAPIAALQVPGKTTVVSFTDFQCPYCRQTQPILEQIEKRPDVEFHRFMAPLELHPGAEPAALAYLCAPEKSRDALATLFYTAEEEKLTSTGVVEMASTLGLDGDAIAECMVHGKGPELLAADKKVYQDVGGAGLPTTYIGSNLIIGFDPDRYQRVLSHPGPRSFSLPVWGMFVLTGLVILWGAISADRFRPGASEPRSEGAKKVDVEDGTQS